LVHPCCPGLIASTSTVVGLRVRRTLSAVAVAASLIQFPFDLFKPVVNRHNENGRQY
jgi:hypothetical protein